MIKTITNAVQTLFLNEMVKLEGEGYTEILAAGRDGGVWYSIVRKPQAKKLYGAAAKKAKEKKEAAEE